MPIVVNGNEVSLEYEIPRDIKEIITNDFLKEFRNQLFRINGYYHLGTFAEEGIPMNTSTSGWYAAFGKACLFTNKEELFDYYRTLEWYDADIFDGELAEMLIERGFILGDLSKVVEQQLGFKPYELRVCDECGGLYAYDMVEILDYNEVDMTDRCICLHCSDQVASEDKNENATDYYRDVLNELDEYKEKNPI